MAKERTDANEQGQGCCVCNNGKRMNESELIHARMFSSVEQELVRSENEHQAVGNKRLPQLP